MREHLVKCQTIRKEGDGEGRPAFDGLGCKEIMFDSPYILAEVLNIFNDGCLRAFPP